MLRRFINLAIVLLLITGCSWQPQTQSYKSQYAHINTHRPIGRGVSRSQYYLVMLVEACHLDYSDGKSFLRTMVKHPSDGTKNSDVGHAWILLHGESYTIEGGHSGELGIDQPRYFEGVMNNIDDGFQNPIQYLWATQGDGFFQRGSGGHKPTFAAKVNLTKEQFDAIKSFIETYGYSSYAITSTQCSSFVSCVGRLAGIDLECDVTISVPRTMRIGREEYSLWNDPKYSFITISSPDILEKKFDESCGRRASRICSSLVSQTPLPA